MLITDEGRKGMDTEKVDHCHPGMKPGKVGLLHCVACCVRKKGREDHMVLSLKPAKAPASVALHEKVSLHQNKPLKVEFKMQCLIFFQLPGQK